jgi:hypothetical protein
MAIEELHQEDNGLVRLNHSLLMEHHQSEYTPLSDGWIERVQEMINEFHEVLH